MAIIMSNSSRGGMMRRPLPALIGLRLLAVWLLVVRERERLYTRDFGFPVFFVVRTGLIKLVLPGRLRACKLEDS